MKTSTISGTHRNFVPLAILLATLSGCASSSKPPALAQATTPAAVTAPAPTPVAVSAAEAMPPGRTHGMPATSRFPQPQWYADRYYLARGVGEAIRLNHMTQWDKEAKAYSYYIGGVLFAHYQPFDHNLEIRSDEQSPEISCRWNENGGLAATPAGSEDVCGQLLDELNRHVARTGKYPAIGSQNQPE